jgi:hypothetical protein
MLILVMATANHRSHRIFRTEYDTSRRMFEKCTR